MFENLELATKADKRVWPTLTRDARFAPRATASLSIARDDPAAPEAARLAGLLSHGQKQWLEIGMLLMQEPQLLLLDEPVAGMTDDETMRSAELFRSLAGDYTLVVVEHDMDFVAQIADRVTVLHEGRVLAEGSMQQVQQNEQVIEVFLGPLTHAQQSSRTSTSITAAAISCATWRSTCPTGKCTTLLGRNGVRQDDAAQVPDGPAADPLGRHPASTARASPRCRRMRARALGIGYVPQGRDIFPRLTVAENLQMGLATQKTRRRRSELHLRDVSGAEGHARPARRRPFRAASSSSSRSAARSRCARSF